MNVACDYEAPMQLLTTGKIYSARAYRRHKILLTAVLNLPITTFLEIDLQNYFKASSFGIVVVVYIFGCVIIFSVVNIRCVTLDMPR